MEIFIRILFFSQYSLDEYIDFLLIGYQYTISNVNIIAGSLFFFPSSLVLLAFIPIFSLQVNLLNT